MSGLSIKQSQIFHAFFDYLEEIDEMLSISVYSIHGMKGRGELAEIATRGRHREANPSSTSEELSEAEENYIKHVKRLEELALSQADSGLPLWFAHASVSLWSALEATVPDLAAQALIEDKSLLESDDFLKVRLPASALISPQDEQISIVISELGRQTNAPLKQGVGRFTPLLEAVGLGIAIDEGSRRTLLELSQARNNIVHRFSTVDKHFKQVCPWIPYQPGERLKISSEDYARYKKAVVDYVMLILSVFKRRIIAQQTTDDQTASAAATK